MPLNFKKTNEQKEEKTQDSSNIAAVNSRKGRTKMEFLIESPKYNFDDIILNSEQLKSLKIASSYFKHKDLLMEIWGMKKYYKDKGGLLINLYGESGTGKTMSAHAIASSLNKNLVIVNYAEIESKYVGETSKNIVDLFNYAQNEDVVILFDEADALLSKRVTNMSSSTDVSVNQTKSVLLNVLNSYTGIVIFTTNFISNFDYAFLRRINFQIKFDLPDEEQRKQIWNMYLSTGIPHTLNVDVLAKRFAGISGSDIANAVWIAALETAEYEDQQLTEDRIVSAINQILKAKNANKGNVIKDDAEIVSIREVSEEYALEQIKKGEKK